MVQQLSFKHVVDIPRLDSSIATARDHRNKTHIYLLVNHDGPVYKRNGINGTWDELESGVQQSLRELLKRAEGQVRRYTTDNYPSLN